MLAGGSFSDTITFMNKLPAVSKDFHHAYVVSGTKETTALLLADLDRLGVKTKGNPDFFCDTFASFGVEEALGLIARSMSKPVMGGNKYFVLTVSSISREAQNTLLKLLEEPSGESVFFLVVPSAGALLPTLRSRMHVLSYQAVDATAVALARTFLAESFSERIDMLKRFVDEKDSERVMVLLSALERTLSKMRRDIAFSDGLRAIWRARRHISQGSASFKMMLEQVALLVPRVKTV